MLQYRSHSTISLIICSLISAFSPQTPKFSFQTLPKLSKPSFVRGRPSEMLPTKIVTPNNRMLLLLPTIISRHTPHCKITTLRIFDPKHQQCSSCTSRHSGRTLLVFYLAKIAVSEAVASIQPIKWKVLLIRGTRIGAILKNVCWEWPKNPSKL